MLPVASRAPFKPLAAPAAALSVSPTPKPSPPALAPASFAMASPLMGGCGLQPRARARASLLTLSARSLYAGADEAAAAFSAVDDILAGFGELPAAAAAAPAVAPVAEPVRQQVSARCVPASQP